MHRAVNFRLKGAIGFRLIGSHERRAGRRGDPSLALPALVWLKSLVAPGPAGPPQAPVACARGFPLREAIAVGWSQAGGPRTQTGRAQDAQWPPFSSFSPHEITHT